MRYQYPPGHQRGAALLMTLVMLLVVTILGVQMISRGNLNQQLAQNESSRLLTEHHAQNVANIILSDVNHFLTPSSIQVLDANGVALEVDPVSGDPKVPDSLENGSYTVSYTDPVCTHFEVVAGNDLEAEVVAYTYHWIFDVTVTDSFTGAETTLEVGTRFNYTAGACV